MCWKDGIGGVLTKIFAGRLEVDADNAFDATGTGGPDPRRNDADGAWGFSLLPFAASWLYSSLDDFRTNAGFRFIGQEENGGAGFEDGDEIDMFTLDYNGAGKFTDNAGFVLKGAEHLVAGAAVLLATASLM